MESDLVTSDSVNNGSQLRLSPERPSTETTSKERGPIDCSGNDSGEATGEHLG